MRGWYEAASALESSSSSTKRLCVVLGKHQGILNQLVQLIHHPNDSDEEAADAAIRAVSALSSFEENIESLIRNGMVNGLVTYITRTQKRERSLAPLATAIVERLLQVESGREELLKCNNNNGTSGNGIHALVKMVFRVSWSDVDDDHEHHRGSESAVASLLIVCNDSLSAREEAIGAGVLTQLLLLMQSQCSSSTKAKARMLLKLLKTKWSQGYAINIALDPLLIFVCGLGIRGAAIAHVLSQYLMALVLFLILMRKVNLMPPSIKDLQFGKFLKNGSLLLARVVAVTFCVTLGASLAARLGPTPMAAFQTGLQVWLTSSLLADGLAVAGQSGTSSRRKYDVFLSFRGVDTRRTVVSFLYHELLKREIKTFKDDKGLEAGEPISPSLGIAIKESWLAIVVLSPNYASSQWCLHEVKMIVDYMEDKNMIVLPVFYDVDPSDVRHQKVSFAAALTSHEERFGVEVVNQWRAALTKVANLSGLESKNYGTRPHVKFYV